MGGDEVKAEDGGVGVKDGEMEIKVGVDEPTLGEEVIMTIRQWWMVTTKGEQRESMEGDLAGDDDETPTTETKPMRICMEYNMHGCLALASATVVAAAWRSRYGIQYAEQPGVGWCYRRCCSLALAAAPSRLRLQLGGRCDAHYSLAPANPKPARPR